MSDAPSPDAAESGPTPTPGRSLAVIGLLGVLVVGAMMWWVRPPTGALEDVTPTSLAGTPIEGSPFIGTKACKNCHPGEYAAHSASGHARTLRSTGVDAVASQVEGRRLDDPERPGVRWSYRREGGKLVADRQEGRETRSIPLDYALGSGTHAMTFVSLVKETHPPSGEEHRLSYFAHSNAMAITPGQTEGGHEPGRSATGMALPPPVVLDCFECHGTRTAAPKNGGLAPETLIPNVSCERCHGPGRAHAEAALAGATDPNVLAMSFAGDRETAAEQVAMCGRCHRLPSMVPADTIRPENASLARFPSVGLTQSACFTKSAGELSCTTCHDPHARASNEATRYDATCRSCHTPAEKANATTCPINPRDGCVSCHMPRREAGFGLTFSDHWIRVPDGDKAAR